MRYHLITVRMAIVKMSTNNRCWRRCEQKGTLLHCWWECKLVQPLWRTVWRPLKKLEIELPHDPAILLLGTYLQKMKTLIQKDTCTPMFIAALLTTAKTWKQPKCSLTDEWIKKMWYIYTMEYYSVTWIFWFPIIYTSYTILWSVKWARALLLPKKRLTVTWIFRELWSFCTNNIKDHWSQITITNVIIIVWNIARITKIDKETPSKPTLLERWCSRRAWHRVATNLQFV